ncbi:MAG: hypothetical protein DRP97_06365 [Candidatus Latescibacterota bacterium]|nr:MAG: hypothetical protein DRP97_06365 [Candidatus Latescibacterota bacterium]
MKKPEKYNLKYNLEGESIYDVASKRGYNQACDDWEKYHEWYIKEHYVRKDSLPDEEEILKIINDGFDVTDDYGEASEGLA